MQNIRRKVYEVALSQRGLVTRADLARVGATRSQLQRLQGEGALRPVQPGVFLAGGAAPDRRTILLAATLSTGGVAVARSAAELHRIPGLPRPDVPEVLIQGRSLARLGPDVVVHRTTWLPGDDLVVVEGIPCTSVARTLFSLAALVPEVPLDVVRGAVDEAVRLRLASDDWLWWRLEKLRCRGRNGVRAFESILTARADSPTESWLERQMLRVLERGGLPAPRCQRRIARRGAFVARVDFLYEPERVVLEVTGAVAHSTPIQRAADAKRRNALITAGYTVLEFTYEQVVGEPAAVVAQVRAALAARRAA